MFRWLLIAGFVLFVSKISTCIFLGVFFKGQRKEYIQFGKLSNLWVYSTAFADKIKKISVLPWRPPPFVSKLCQLWQDLITAG